MQSTKMGLIEEQPNTTFSTEKEAQGRAKLLISEQQEPGLSKILKTLHFESETGMPQYDPAASKVYVNLQDQDIFAVIDPASGGDTFIGGLGSVVKDYVG